MYREYNEVETRLTRNTILKLFCLPWMLEFYHVLKYVSKLSVELPIFIILPTPAKKYIKATLSNKMPIPDYFRTFYISSTLFSSA